MSIVVARRVIARTLRAVFGSNADRSVKTVAAEPAGTVGASVNVIWLFLTSIDLIVVRVAPLVPKVTGTPPLEMLTVAPTAKPAVTAAKVGLPVTRLLQATWGCAVSGAQVGAA